MSAIVHDSYDIPDYTYVEYLNNYDKDKIFVQAVVV